MNYDDLVLYLAGGFASPVLKWLKGWLNWDGVPMFIVTLIVSFIVAAAAFTISGEDLTPENLAAGLAKVLGGATIIYNFLIAEH